MRVKNKISIILLGVVLSAGFSACQTGKKYQTPEVDSDKLYRDQLSSDTNTIANIPWHRYFTDPVLQDLIKEGLDKNYDMQVATEVIKRAEVGLNIAKAAYFPDVALVGNVTHGRASSYNGQKDVLGYHNTDYTLGVSATWEADIWGKMRRESKAAYAQFLSGYSYRNLIQTSLISNIATSYYALIAMDEQLKVTIESIKLLEKTVVTMEALKDAGMLNGAAVEQSKALYHGTLVSVPELRSQIFELENNICLLIGRKPSKIDRTSLKVQNVVKDLKVGVPMQMLSRRPDVLQAELALRSAFELKNAAKASLYPSITLGTGSMIGFNATNVSDLFKPESIIANILGGLAQPLFARKKLIGNLKIKESQESEALIKFEQAVLNAGTEVSNVLYSYQSSLQKNDNRNKQVDALNKSVDYTQLLLNAGESTYLEVLTAQQDLLKAQLAQVGDKLSQLQYSVSLYRALGGGANNE